LQITKANFSATYRSIAVLWGFFGGFYGRILPAFAPEIRFGGQNRAFRGYGLRLRPRLRVFSLLDTSHKCARCEYAHPYNPLRWLSLAHKKTPGGRCLTTGQEGVLGICKKLFFEGLSPLS